MYICARASTGHVSGIVLCDLIWLKVDQAWLKTESNTVKRDKQALTTCIGSPCHGEDSVCRRRLSYGKGHFCWPDNWQCIVAECKFTERAVL